MNTLTVMPVIPASADLLQNQTALFEFLTVCQHTAVEKEHPQVVSITAEIPPVDPLSALQQLQQWATPKATHGSASLTATEPVYFYCENKLQGVALCAADPLLQMKAEGSRRFQLAQNFVGSTLVDAIAAGNLELPFAGLHFFCSFTFFDHNPVDAPFPAATVFLPRWHIACTRTRGVMVANLLVEANSNLTDLAATFWGQLQQLRSVSHLTLPDAPLGLPIPLQQHATQSHLEFKAVIQDALSAIEQETYRKLVLANAVDVSYSQPLNVLRSLDNLRHSYPDCYVFSMSNGKGQTFIGASPERLLSLNGKELLIDALAGSAPRGKSDAEDKALANNLLHSDKDRHEHQIIIDLICQCLQHLGIPYEQPLPPKLLQLQNIQHLQTLIRAQHPSHLHLLDILAQLHPTPAVSGAPRAIACEQIRHYESFERDLYAAPLGWINHQGQGEFIVGIRSALIQGCQARLYAGAGIVAGSDPDRELAEVQLKLQVLLDALS
jgi:menaquinone-specific isochorismate synthase